MERRTSYGKERKAHCQETRHEVSQSAQEIAESQNPIKTGQEEVRATTRRDFVADLLGVIGHETIQPFGKLGNDRENIFAYSLTPLEVEV